MYKSILLILFIIPLYPVPFVFAQESRPDIKMVCVEKNVLLQGNFTVNIRPKPAEKDCQKFEEEMQFQSKGNGKMILLPLPSKMPPETAPVISP